MSSLSNYWHASVALQTNSANSSTSAFQHTRKNKYKTKSLRSASPSSRLLPSETTPSRPAKPVPSRHSVSCRTLSKRVHGPPPLSIIFSCFYPWAEEKNCVFIPLILFPEGCPCCLATVFDFEKISYILQSLQIPGRCWQRRLWHVRSTAQAGFKAAKRCF